jgi:hypothetical protein
MNCNKRRVLIPIFQYSNILIFRFLSVLKNICTIADRCYSKDAAGDWSEANYDNNFLYRTQTNCARHLTKRKKIQSTILYPLQFFRFTNGKCEFSSSDPAGDFLGTYGQFNVSSLIKVGSKFDRRHVSRLLHQPYSPDIRL